MKNIRNQVQLIGILGLKPEMVHLESGNKLARVSLISNEEYENSNGEKIVEAQRHKLIAWEKVAENMVLFLEKGQEVAINGKLTYRTYINKEGIKKYFTEIVVNEFMLIGKDAIKIQKPKTPHKKVKEKTAG